MPDGAMRCHFSSIIFNAFKTLWALIVLIIAQIANNISNLKSGDINSTTLSLSTAGMILLLVVFFLFYYFRWRKTFIYIENDSLVVDKQFFINRSKTTVKLSSIATVNLQQNLFERFFNTYRLQIDIDSSVTADKTDFNLVFSKDNAIKMKHILTENSSEEFGSDEEIHVKEPEIQQIFKFSVKRVIKHCLLSISVSGVVLSIIILVSGLYGNYLSSSESGNSMGLVFSILFSLVPVLYQSLTPFIKYQNFTIGKQGKKIIISYGFITTRQFTLPIDKTNAIIIKQPLMARIFKLYYGEIINVGMGDDEKNAAPIFCLCVKKDELDYILKEISPEFIIADATEHSPKTAFVPVLTGSLIGGLIPLIPSIILGYWWAGVIVYAFIILCGYVSYRTKGLNLAEDRVGISTGIFLKKTIIVPYGKIQNIKIKNGPVSRRFGLFKGEVCILSTLANRVHAIGYFPEKYFEKISEKIMEFDSFSYLLPCKGE